jgi:hypothetical protein
MNEFHPMIYLFNPIHKWNQSVQKMTFNHTKSFIYGHIHLCRWIKTNLNFKLQAQNSKHKLYPHAQAILILVVQISLSNPPLLKEIKNSSYFAIWISIMQTHTTNLLRQLNFDKQL